MKSIFYIILSALLLCFTSCKEKVVDPKDAPRQAMNAALQKLTEQDYEGYLAYAYLDGEDDSVHIDLLKKAFVQQQQYKLSKQGDVARYDVVDVRFEGDSVCTVLYQYAYSDSTKEVCSQKMVLVNGDWKIRIRN